MERVEREREKYTIQNWNTLDFLLYHDIILGLS